jgi:proteasome assembly chaperone (PAC2) family protein
MDKPYTIIGDLPEINEPLLVVMMSGWIDTSSAAANAMDSVSKETKAKPIISFDNDTFVDYRARRPIMELRDGVNTKLVWSTPEIALGQDINGKDVLLLTGPEPDTRWHLFAQTIADISVEFGVRRMIGIGAYPFATPHTRAVYISCTSPDKDLVANLPYIKSSVDVPAGMAAAIEHALFERRIQALGLWARVPHYVASMPYPAASAALLAALCDSGGISIDVSAMREQATTQRERLDQLIAGNNDHAQMLTQLEQSFDEQIANGTTEINFGGPIPSGEEIAAEFEKYLREH